MDRLDIKDDRAGKAVSIPGGLWAFVPHKLPPWIEAGPRFLQALGGASSALSRVDGAMSMFPPGATPISPLLWREASASARIEGAGVTCAEAVQTELECAPMGSEVDEAAACHAAMQLGLDRMPEVGFGVELLKLVHAEAMRGAHWAYVSPGRFREVQTFIGVRQKRLATASYVPPPWQRIAELMADWEHYARQNRESSALVQAAILHAQFEMIHPFMDGNGKVGRMAMNLFLLSCGRLRYPVLLLSPYFERTRPEYYHTLRGVSHEGLWEQWVLYFLRGVTEESDRLLAVAQRLNALREETREHLITRRASPSALRLLDTLLDNPYTDSHLAADKLGATPRAARAAIATLERLGVLEAIPGPRCGQRFRAPEIVEALHTDG
ncbi:MAG: Fic family protein [Armatimonadetes bacterium]|nr:Fic family protein [Armatimonadota bacterium]